MKIAPWDSYDSTMDAIEEKMEHEFQALSEELAAAGVVSHAME